MECDCVDAGDTFDLIPGDSPEASASPEEAGRWQQFFIDRFIRRPGQHLLEIGKTGTGKTQFLYWIVDMLREYSPHEAIVWFDIGKGDEILTLVNYFGRLRQEPVRIATLPGCEIEIDGPDGIDLEFVTVARCADVWKQIRPGRLLIASFEPFIEDPNLAVRETAATFKELSYLAHRRGIYAPTAIIYDEFHNVCPAVGYGFAGTGKEGRLQTQSINLIRQNVQKLRSQRLRLVCTAHQWMQLNRGVRASFEWLVPRRGTIFGWDDVRLRDFNPLWRRMRTDECYIVLPDGSFSRSLRLPYYTDGSLIGQVRYGGIYEVKKNESRCKKPPENAH